MLKGYVGQIKSTDMHTASVLFTMENQDIDMPLGELCKHCKRGYFVEVMHNAFVGVQGFVVNKSDHLLVIVKILAFQNVHQSLCKEVRLFVDVFIGGCQD